MSVDDRPGPTVLLGGRYRLERLLGQGAMAAVHRAVDERTGARVAVKLFRDPLAPGAQGEVRSGEVRALEGLRHPGLVELLDVGEDGSRPFCVMTLVEGPTLAERLAQGPLSPATTARVGSDLAAALAYVHDRGVVHRDVKPANVLLAADGRARLADFGIARLVDATRVTRSGFTVGTAGYLAPEQVTGGDVAPAADVYALGLVLLECLTGRREYDGPVIEAALARLHRPPVLPADLPRGWRALLAALTASDPAQRPTSALAASAAAVLAEDPGAPPEALRLGTVPDRAPAAAAPVAPVPEVVAAGRGDLVQVPAGGSGAQRVRDTAPDLPQAPSDHEPRPAPGAAPRRRRRWLLASAAGLLLVGGAATAALVGDDEVATPAASAPGPAQPGDALASPATALSRATEALDAARRADPARTGADAPAVLSTLREVAALEGAEQASAAVLAAEQVRAAEQAGRLEPAQAGQVTLALDRVAAPQDLLALVRLSRPDPEALGTDGPAVERLLTALDHEAPTADVPRTAADLLRRVQDGVASGALVPAYGRAAMPVLELLARPEPLADLARLVDDLGADPAAAGSAGEEVLERLDALQETTVYQRTLDARALARDVDEAADDGELSEDLRLRARPVLDALAQRR